MDAFFTKPLFATAKKNGYNDNDCNRKGERKMFEILASLFKYLFIIFIYYFIYTIIRLIYVDITTTTVVGKKLEGKNPYLKLINQRESLPFRMEDSYFLEDGTTLGRSGRNNIVIKDPFLSGLHLRFTEVENRWFLQDMNSKNGTLLNHQPLENHPTELMDGDLIRLGQLEFLFVEPGRNRS